MRPLLGSPGGCALGERGDGPREVHGRHFASHGRVILEPLLIAEQTDRDHHEVDEITGLRERLVTARSASEGSRASKSTVSTRLAPQSSASEDASSRSPWFRPASTTVWARAAQSLLVRARAMSELPASTTTHCGCPNAFSTSRSHEVETSCEVTRHNVLGVHSVLDLKECVELGIHGPHLLRAQSGVLREINPPARQEDHLVEVVEQSR